MLAAGMPEAVIDAWVKRGRLHVIFEGAYAVGHAHLDRPGRWHAAVLACGEGAVLSHRDAAALYGIRDSWRRDIDVTAPGRSRHRRAGITVHRPRSLYPDDVCTQQDIPSTTLPRTLLDLSEVISFDRLVRAYNEAARRDLLECARSARRSSAPADGAACAGCSAYSRPA
jgi:predicted transcriptional regulator of viral defense system